jgi:hypothetical protein
MPPRQTIKNLPGARALLPAYHWLQFWGRVAGRNPDFLYERWRLKRFRGLHCDRQRCFLVGNGPSIRSQDLRLLKDEIVFVTNHFHHHEHYEALSPTYYCVSDPVVFRHGVEPRWGAGMQAKTKSAIKFFPLKVKRAVRHSPYFAGHTIYYLNYAGYEVVPTGTMSLNPSITVYQGNTVMIDFCIPLAFYMGFREIYLVGCDCDYQLAAHKNFAQSHFYDAALQTTEPAASEEYHRTQWTNDILTAYAIVQRVLAGTGCQIYNATAGGKLEIFPRVRYEDVARPPGR